MFFLKMKSHHLTYQEILKSPAKVAFLGSLLLSFIAYWNAPILNKDGAFYLDLAKTFSDAGFSAVLQRYDWSWFSILISISHQLTSLPLESCAHLWCAFFMAGACSLSVACVEKHLESAGWLACLVVLSLPAFNSFRGEILRDFGFWFFCMLTIWLAMKWEARPGWFAGVLVQLAVLGAVLFRREALLLVPSIILWQMTDRRWRKDWQRYAQLNTLPVAGVFLLGFYLFAVGGFSKAGIYWQLISPEKFFAKFAEISDLFATTVLTKYSWDDAGYILGVGFLAVILLKFIMLMGPFVVPLLFRSSWTGIKTQFGNFRLSCFAWLFYLIVLMVFFVQLQFINSRYTSFLNWLAIPFVTLLLLSFSKEYPKLSRFLLAISLVVMLDNVVSFSAKKTHYREAGQWLAGNVPKNEQIYYEDERIRYYAGWGYSMDQVPKAAALSPEHVGEYRYFVLEGKADEPWLREFLTQQHKRILTQFSNKKKNTVLVIGD